MRLILLVTLFFALKGCGTVSGAVQGLGDDFFRLVEFGADKVI